MMASTEWWQRGPIEGVPAVLQPVAHILLQVRESVGEMVAGLSEEEWNHRPANVASAAFHVRHITGVIDRLFTYARGQALTPEQLAAIKLEGAPLAIADVAGVLDALSTRVDAAIAELKAVDVTTLGDFRGVGRKQLPSTVIGCLVHGAEHAMRHVGQLSVTIRVVRQSGQPRRLLQHFLAALAYRTQKALRGAPASFGEFDIGSNARTPHELVWHMTGVIGYARTMLRGGTFEPPRLATFDDEIVRFHETVQALWTDFADPALTAQISDEQFLQGPLSDAMTHAGQLAMLRRLHGSPVASENFIFAGIESTNVSANQPEPKAPDRHWSPDAPPPAPGPRPKSAREA